VDRLRAIDAFDDTMIIITGDHGVAFQTGEPNRGVSKKNAPHIAWTPLFIKYPNETSGKVDDRAARNIDIMPTIGATLGVKFPWKMDGRSLLGPVPNDEPRKFFDFKINTWHPPKGENFLYIDPSRFAEVRAGVPTGDVGDPLRLYRMVPHGEIVGHQVNEYALGTSASFSAHINNPNWSRNITLNDKIFWADITGTASGLSAKHHLVIAVNGTVCAVVPVSPNGAKPTSWWGRLCPNAMKNGPNDIAAYELQGDEQAPILARVAIR
jgi:hypothetical protein